MWNFLFGFSIRRRVLAVITARIKNAEARMKVLCEKIDEEALEKKERAADDMVTEILASTR